MVTVKRVSIVVPVYNEEDNIEHFVQSVEAVMEQLPYDYELLFIDDGSRDRSRAILRELGERDVRVQSIFLTRNSGHQLALTCGTDHANGDAVITMDGDMQHPPELLPVLLAQWEAGYEIVQTVRLTTEGASLFKRLTSKYYYRLLNAMTDVEIQEGGSDFRLMDRKAVLALRRYREHARFIRGGGVCGARALCREVQVLPAQDDLLRARRHSCVFGTAPARCILHGRALGTACHADLPPRPL